MDLTAETIYPDVGQDSEPLQDNFYTPANQDFYHSGQYSELDQCEQEIRLFKLLAPEEEGQIKVELETTRLKCHTEMPKKYNAISYFAGKHFETEVIYVNDVEFNAFANLVSALRQIQSSKEFLDQNNHPQLFWADQICINQSKLDERSHQVNFMRKIYEHANVVLAYLGPSSNDHNWVKAASQLEAGRTQDCSINLDEETLTFDGDKYISVHDQEFQQDWESLRALLKCPWWHRGWIYQEVLVAQKVVVLFGAGIMDWDHLTCALHIVHELKRLLYVQLFNGKSSEAMCRVLCGHEPASHGVFLVQQRHKWQADREANILELLCHARRCEVTDARDRVFAFTGLADPGYGIIPDYKATISALVRHICKRIILFDENLNSLIYCTTNREWRSKRKDIPSWSSDWSCRKIENFYFIYGPAMHSPRFRASDHTTSAVAFHSHGHDADSILEVQCLFIDRLANEGSLGPFSESCELQNDKEWKRLAGSTSKTSRESYVINKTMSLKVAFVRVLLRGRRPKDPQRGLINRQLTLEYGRFFRSPKGYLGVTKHIGDLRCTDYICVLLGAAVPFILRRIDDHFILISDAYVEGLMYGEAIKLMEQGVLSVETIRIH